MQQMTMVVNKCNYKYKVYSCTAACSDIELVSSPSARSPKLSDGCVGEYVLLRSLKIKAQEIARALKQKKLPEYSFKMGWFIKSLLESN